jgi:lactoylglutathione lyase
LKVQRSKGKIAAQKRQAADFIPKPPHRTGIYASKLFYEKLGFTAFAGDLSQNWLIMKNGDHAVGLFQGMFDKNILTFNPGWSSDAQQLGEFTDVRELQRQLKDRGVDMISEADDSSTGPASFVIVDPDGNTILVDQHV